MRTFAIAIIGLYASFAFAQAYTTAMTIRLVNPDGSSYNQDIFHQAEVEFHCDNGYMKFFTNNVQMLKLESAMSMKKTYANQQECLDKQLIIQNTSDAYKMMVIIDKDTNVSDLRFCPMQSADEDCFKASFNLQAR